ncbi:hypothetical protein Tco_1079874 [Tanacetum coccineum]|uniref:Uncharacterized protein n=1 Tax=Tanacetum coccineum TaxID=301880 RepID=A0ABQ5HTA7_9ASTR
MEEFVTKNQANYYSGITSITVNGKAAYELKGRFLNDLRENAFSGTNGEDAAEHIEYILKIVDPIDLPNVNHERLRLAVFPISLVGYAIKRFDEFKGSITTWVDNQEVVTNEGFSDLEKANNDDEHKIAKIFRIETNLLDYETPLCTKFNEFKYLLKVDTKLFTHDVERTMIYEDYKNEWNNEVDEQWPGNGVPYEICDHICEPFHFKNGKAKWPTCNSNEDGFCNGGELLGMVLVGYMTYFQDYEWYDDLTDSSLKEEALKRKAIFEKSWGDATQNHTEMSILPMTIILRVGMVEHATTVIFRKRRNNTKRDNVEEYVDVKEYEYDDFTRTNEDACHAYQEIFHNMDKGWLVTRVE